MAKQPKTDKQRLRALGFRSQGGWWKSLGEGRWLHVFKGRYSGTWSAQITGKDATTQHGFVDAPSAATWLIIQASNQ